jgi:thioredoxin reductase
MKFLAHSPGELNIMVKDTDVAIIGAGPYGMSCSAYLRGRGVEHVIFGSPMAAWRENMPTGMSLKSDGFASSLYDPEDRWTLRQYCSENGLPYADLGLPVSLETFIAYGLYFQTQVVPYLDRREVVHVNASHGRFSLHLNDGDELRARRLVLATGINYYRHIPSELRHLPVEALTHSNDHQDVTRLRGRKIAIIGRGASAVDLAMLAHEAGAEVQIVSRKPRIDFHAPPRESRPLWVRMRYPTTGVGPGWWNYFYWRAPDLFRRLPSQMRQHHVRTALGPAPGWFVRDRVAGKFPMHLGWQISGATLKNSHVALHLTNDGKSADVKVDHIIAATGFQTNIARLGFLDEPLKRKIATHHGAPLLSKDFETSVPGLYFVGMPSAPTFGPVMRFAVGARFTASRLSRHLAHPRHHA